MTKINLGKSNRSSDIYIDLDTLLKTRLLIQANSGGGKSYTIRRIVEQAAGAIQTIIIDPEGEFATLRERFDFILVGKGGDTPADTRSAQMLAHRLLELNTSAVCDLYEMKSAERHRWVRLFLEALIDSPKELWHPLLVIVDEAHAFAPEKGSGESESSESIIALCTRGRKRGFCAILATQRLGKLRKDAAAELTNVLIGQTFIDIDLKRAADALGISGPEAKLFYNEVKVIEPGNFFALGRAISKERILVKVGAITTTHPEPGDTKSALTPPPSPEKIRSLLPKLSDLPKEAEQKAMNEAELRKQIGVLKKELSIRPTVTVPQVEERLVEIPVFQQADLDRLESVATVMGEKGTELVTTTRALLATMGEKGTEWIAASRVLLEQISQARKVTRPLPPTQNIQIRLPADPIRRENAVRPDTDDWKYAANGRLPVGEVKILTACAQYPEGVTREQLTILTGYKRSSRDTYLQRLVTKGFVTFTPFGGPVYITVAGTEALGPNFQQLPTGDELREYWLNKLHGGEAKILQVICNEYPKEVERENISNETGYARSSRDTYLQRLSARKLVVVTAPSRVKANDNLFG
jgi:hypothetical protein